MNKVLRTELISFNLSERAAKYLDIMLRKFLRKGSPPCSKGVHSIIDCYLAVLVIQEMVDIFPALLQDLLSKQY